MNNITTTAYAPLAGFNQEYRSVRTKTNKIANRKYLRMYKYTCMNYNSPAFNYMIKLRTVVRVESFTPF